MIASAQDRADAVVEDRLQIGEVDSFKTSIKAKIEVSIII